MDSKASIGLGARQVLLSALLLLGGVGVLHVLCLHFFAKALRDPWDLSDFYPLSVFKFRRPSSIQLAGAGALLGAFVALSRTLSRRRLSLGWLVVVGVALAVGSNLLHGWRYGIDYPTATLGDSGIEYYNDAVLVQGALWFLARFNAIQFELLEHSRTHPPGAVLLYFALHRLLRNPGLISIGIDALFVAIAVPSLRRLLQLVFGAAPPLALLSYLVFPANLIYGLATLDAAIAGFFLATLICFIDESRRGLWLVSAPLLAVSLFSTFGALFLLPVLFGYEWLKNRRLVRSSLVLVVSALLIYGLKPLTGYDWLASFWRAAAMENAKGFLLFAEPGRYLWYRLGAVAEIALFLGPVACWMWLRGWSVLRRSSVDGARLAWLGPLSLALMLLAGAMKIGEAARICLFILPYLALPVVATLRALSERDQLRSLYALFGWGLFMQLFGFYQW